MQTPTTRRQFSKFLAAMAGATAAVPATAFASPDDDSELLKLEEEIFDAWWAVNAHNDEIARLDDIRRDEYERLLAQEKAEGRFIGYEERWQAASSTPDGRELARLVTITTQHAERMTSLIDKVWAIPAHTEAGRQAKADVAICCVLDWRDRDDEVGWRVRTTRRLLADLVGGEAGRNMREQFA
jgi:hypothetical protein